MYQDRTRGVTHPVAWCRLLVFVFCVYLTWRGERQAPEYLSLIFRQRFADPSGPLHLSGVFLFEDKLACDHRRNRPRQVLDQYGQTEVTDSLERIR